MSCHWSTRFEWCRLIQLLTREWNRILFSDKAQYCLWVHDGGTINKILILLLKDTIQSIMISEHISYGSRPSLVFFFKPKNANLYISNVLESFTNAECYLQQNNKRSHGEHAGI